MGRTKAQVTKFGSDGVICCRPGKSSRTNSVVPPAVAEPIASQEGLKDGKAAQTPRESVSPVAEPTSQALSPVSKLPGQRPSVFDSNYIAQPPVSKKRAAETAAERDAKKLKIDGNDRLDPRKAAPAIFDLQADNDAPGVRTRGSMKASTGSNGETGRSRPPGRHALTARNALKAKISKEKPVSAVAQGASLGGMSRHDSVAASSDLQDVMQAVRDPTNDSSSGPDAVTPMRGTKRKAMLPSDDDEVQMLSADDEEDTVVAKPAPAKTAKRAVRRNELANLATDGTTALKCEVTNNSNRYVKEYSVDGGKAWYRLDGSTSDLPDWIQQADQVQERWADISRGVDDGEKDATSGYGRKIKKRKLSEY